MSDIVDLLHGNIRYVVLTTVVVEVLMAVSELVRMVVVAIAIMAVVAAAILLVVEMRVPMRASKCNK